MITIKLPYKTNEDLKPIIRKYSSVVRYSYNRFLKGKSEKEIWQLIKTLNNINLLNSWLINCAIGEGKTIYNRFKNEKIIFGGKSNFFKRIKNKISKEEFKLNKLIPLHIKGEILYKGNRLFKLDIIENNQIIFKLNRSKHIVLNLPKLKKKYKKAII